MQTIKKKKKTGRPFNEVYESEEFLESLEEYYDTYGTFKIVAARLNEDFNTNAKPNTIAEIYKKRLAIKLGTDEDASKFFENSFIRMQKRWEDSWEMIGDLVNEYKKMRKLIKEKSQDEFTEALTFMKMSSQIIQITAEIRKQLEFISKQQEEIKVYQQNNLIISPVQINQEILNRFSDMSDEEMRRFFQTIKDSRFAKFAEEMEKAERR